MKRDWDLIRAILVQIEDTPANGDFESSDIKIEGKPQSEITEHLRLIEGLA
jgi:hypothetical protein